jgi:hypothetical protein
MTVPVDPRRLNPAEYRVMRHILLEEFDGHEALLAQLDRAEVVGSWGPGSVSVDLRVPDAAAAHGVSGPVPKRSLITDDNGELVGELILWVTEGVLSALEYAWYGDDAPRELPSPDAISFVES